MSFADKRTQELFLTGSTKRMSKELARRAMRRLEYVHYATCMADLRVPQSNRLHALHGDREGQYAIRVNDQWRICFRFSGGNAYEVEITDYH